MRQDQWTLIEVSVSGALVEIAAAVLGACGSQGVVTEERALDSFSVPDEDYLAERDYHLKAYFQGGEAPEVVRGQVEAALQQVPALAQLAVSVSGATAVGEQDWAENWKQNFPPMQIGQRLLIRPSWEQGEPPAGVALVEIDPGMAFGTGSHGTTRLCLEMIEELMGAANPPASLLDVGTGSGILSLAAAALGCPAVMATDIDPQACTVARENIAKNGYQQQIEVTGQLLEELDGCYDLVVANILAEENIRLRQPLLEHLSATGTLLLSGILSEKEAQVIAAFTQLPLDFIESRKADEWVCLAFRRRG